MTNYNIELVDRNSMGDVIRCPQCGQVLFILSEIDGKMHQTVQCRRCHTFVSIKAESDDIPEVL